MRNVVVITLLVLGCSFASAQTFRLVSVDGSKDCNFVLTQLTPYAVWEGYSTCPGAYISTLIGISGGLTKKGNPVGFGVKGVVLADNVADAQMGTYTGVQWCMVTNLVCSDKKYGWVAFAGMSGLLWGDNYGYVSCDVHVGSR